ncbi:MAG: hypothetical protein B7Y47_04045 [Sphingomonas sp. 28-63-12]|nr:MAG: hypothetical protein B7Y47_04045 [Sphingomonas sp. 28-63-12]
MTIPVAAIALAMLVACVAPAIAQTHKVAAPAVPPAMTGGGAGAGAGAGAGGAGMATGAMPIGNPGEWFPPESYPPEAKAASQEGRTEFSLDIDAAGRITGCNIVQSSGSELLDSTTCSQLISNGRFKPALDHQGKPMRSNWTSAMRWQLTEAKVEAEE